MAETKEKTAILTPKAKLEQAVEVDTFYLDQDHRGKLAYKYGYVTAGLNAELIKLNEALIEVKSALIDNGEDKNSILIESINNKIITNIF